MRPKKPLFQRVRVPSAQIAQSAPQLYLTSGPTCRRAKVCAISREVAAIDPAPMIELLGLLLAMLVSTLPSRRMASTLRQVDAAIAELTQPASLAEAPVT